MKQAATAINTLPSSKVDFVPTSDQLITLTYGQLQELITQASKKAVQEVTAPLCQEIQDLKESVSSLEARQDQAYERFSGDICDHGQRLIALEKDEPQPLQRDRGEILRSLLVANGGKMFAKDARQKMHLSRSQFSMLLATMKDDIEVKPYHLRKNQRVLVLK